MCGTLRGGTIFYFNRSEPKVSTFYWYISGSGGDCKSSVSRSYFYLRVYDTQVYQYFTFSSITDNLFYIRSEEGTIYILS